MDIFWNMPLNRKADYAERIPAPEWPEGWSLPRVGDRVVVPGFTFTVDRVTFFPQHEDGPHILIDVR
jgi:hypothetical protein